MNWKVFIIIIFIFMAFTTDVVYSENNDGIDVVLVMDSSGSMKKTDPMSLRIPAAKLFISLLDKNDRASVVSFSDTSYPIIHLTPADTESNKNQLLKAADKISSTGLFTNLYDALSGGLGILSEGEKNGRSKVIVIMSDGMMDVGDADKDGELVDKIKNEMAATLEDMGVKVYTIAFTEQSDKLLLEKISKRTGGFYNLALSDKDLHLIFTSIFESLKSPDMAPMSENGFLIDGTIEEVTIVATKGAPQTQIRLNAPDGRSYSNKEQSTGIGWFVSDNFDMITIKTPAAGRWEILFSTGENNKAYIITNLKLQTNFDQLYSTFGDPLDIQIWLEKDSIAIKEQEVLDKFTIHIELTGPDGNASKLEPFYKGDGIFVRSIAPFTPGNYKLRIIAQGNTFEREKAFVFNIADARESKEDILVKRQKVKKAEEKANHPPGKENMSEDISWEKVIIKFILINLVIGIMVIVYFKRNRIKNIRILNHIVSSIRINNLIFRNKEDNLDEKKEAVKEHKTKAEHPSPQEKEKRAEENKPGQPEKQEQDAVPIAKNEKGQEDAVGQKEDEALIKEIPLEDGEQEGSNNIEVEMAEAAQEEESGKPELDSVAKVDNDKQDMEDGNQWRVIEGNENILNQDDLNQLLGAGGDENPEREVEEQNPGMKLEERDEGDSGESGKESNDQEKIDNNVQNEELENMDKLWQEALQSQKDAEEGEVTHESVEKINALDLEIERLEKARNEEINQLNDAEYNNIKEITTRGEIKSQKDETTEISTDENIAGNQQEDIDAIWQEAILEQHAAEGEIKDNKESTGID